MIIKKTKKLSETADVNVIPFIDMLSVIIIFLIMVAAFFNLSILDASLPSAGEEQSAELVQKKEEENQQNLNLTVAITQRGFYIGGAGAILTQKEGEPTIPKKPDGTYDFDALNQKLWEVKQKFPDNWDIILLPEDAIDYQTLLKTMDASREIYIEENGKKVKRVMFPNVGIAAGIM